MNDCVFCQIVEGRVPVERIWEDDQHIAFLSHRPNTPGFTVVATKNHLPSYAFDATDDALCGLVQASRQVGLLLDDAFDDVGRTGLILEGFGVDHLHAKLFPMHGTADPVWRARHSARSEFFETYEGFISSHDADPIPAADLASIAAQIRSATASSAAQA